MTAITRTGDRAFLRSSVYGRAWVLVSFTIVALTTREPILILFEVADASFAAWTWVALRGSTTAADRPPG